ncbi:MAG: pilus assembly protein PilM [Proteobacteria bacterium]|nr:pilus assembly protein PilM [Pseudomonadota bacterium]
MAQFFWQKRLTTDNTGQIGISISKQRLSFAYVKNEGTGEIKLTHLGSICGAKEAQQTYLKDCVSSLHLQGTHATVVLYDKDYQVFLVEQPAVPASEMPKAIRWLVAEYIDFPIEEALVDYIELPQKNNESVKMLYVVVTKKSKVDETVSWIQAAGLTVKTIDICQSALRQIALNLENAEEGQALLHLEEEKSYLIIFKNKTLYMMRDLDLGLNMLSALSEENAKESVACYQDLSVEIQRSLDYCASKLQNANVSRLVITPLQKKRPQLLSNLSNILGLPVREINYTEFMNIKEDVPLKEGACVFAIGAALNQDNL